MKTKIICSGIIALGLSAFSAQAITFLGLGTNGTLYSFDSATPGDFTTIGTPGNGIIEIDFRGSNGRLYGITSTGSLYNINVSDGTSQFISNPMTALTGSVSGFDVNPAADRFRVVTNAASGNNFRLSSTGADTNVVTADGTFSMPPTATILDVAYRNPFSGSSGTALYSVGSDSNLYIHSNEPSDPPGTFNARSLVGSLGFAVGTDVAFDIASDGNGYIASSGQLYRVDGIGFANPAAATSLGTLGQSIASFSAVPEPSVGILGAIASLGLLSRRRRN